MKYKVIAFDLDGTLLNSQGRILASSKNAIQHCIDKGMKVILVTGRHHTAAYPYYHELNLDSPMICCNGTYIYQPKDNQILSANPLSLEQAKTILKISQQYNIHLLMYSRDAMNYVVENDHMQKLCQWVNTCPSDIRPNLHKISDFNDLFNRNEIIWKCVISHVDKNVINQALQHLSLNKFSCEWSWVDRVDIANQGNTKGNRLLALLKLWNIDPQQVIAFGDNHNDISMLDAVGLGVAMGNAEDAVKQCADLVTLTNDEMGISSVLSSIINENE
ncbi:pyridoxal phosphatase [[Haemophilus] felis]|uniref:Pyridoxal phosphatase n=1 Tax=[Haemophilus] felis TaxID=123822 RepID=A0A1T0B555_9PAST|nr:pyridoxal phosphatase [[Haemophilus] felis]NBI41117.1 pyridoxal phosphatase [[Haemophilus] felis]OOS05224.1 pyridoxal phosphatase [[Haemophilus] felis]